MRQNIFQLPEDGRKTLTLAFRIEGGRCRTDFYFLFFWCEAFADQGRHFASSCVKTWQQVNAPLHVPTHKCEKATEPQCIETNLRIVVWYLAVMHIWLTHMPCPVVSDFPLTRLHLSGTKPLSLSVMLPLSVLSNLPFSFQKPCLQPHWIEMRD